MAGLNNNNNPFQGQVRLGPQYVQLVPGPPGPGGGAGGYVTVQINGAPLAAESVLNFLGLDGVDNPGVGTNITLDFANANAIGILPVPHGGTGLGTLTAGALLLGNGVSPVGNLPPGPAGNVVTSTGAAWGSSPAATGFTPGADLVTSTSLLQWVSSLSGPTGDGTETVVAVDRLNFGVDRDSTLSQDTTGQVLGESILIGGQSGINTNFQPGNLNFVVPASRGTGNDAAFQVCYATPEIPMFAVKPTANFGRGWLAIWAAGPDAGIVFGAGNPLFLIDPTGNVYLNSGFVFGQPATLNLSFGQNTAGGNSFTFSDKGAQFFNASLGAGNEVVSIGVCTTPATQGALATTGGVAQVVATVGLQWLSPPHAGGVGEKAFTTTLGAASNDTWNTQAMARPQYLKIGTTVTNGTVVQTVTPPVIATVGAAGRFKVEVVGKTVTAGATGALGDMCSFLFTGSYRNIGGTCTIVGTPKELDASFDTSHVGATVAITASGATYLVTVTAATNAGAVVDWEILTEELTV